MKRFAIVAATVSLITAFVAQPVAAALPTPASGNPWDKNQPIEYRWKTGIEPPAWAKPAMNAAAVCRADAFLINPIGGMCCTISIDGYLAANCTGVLSSPPIIAMRSPACRTSVKILAVRSLPGITGRSTPRHFASNARILLSQRQ